MFNLADMYILDFKLHTKFGDNNHYSIRQSTGFYINNIRFKDTVAFLNSFDKNNNKDECITNPLLPVFHQNFQFLFDVLPNNNYYFLNFGEMKYLTNLSPIKKETSDSPYTNRNLYLRNFNSYPFSVDTKTNGDFTNTYYEKIRRFYLTNEFGSRNTADLKGKSIINLKLDNSVYSIPEGLYKVINNEGSDTYKPYKYIDNFFIKSYPIKQSKIFINNYENYIQSSIEVVDNPSYPLYSMLKFKDDYEFFIRIKKVHSTYYIYYKFKQEDTFKPSYRFTDFYKILNNGTIGFNFINSVPHDQFTILDYKIGKVNTKN